MLRRSLPQFAISLLLAGLALVSAALTFSARPAAGESNQMAKLPSSSRFKCLICHLSPAPVPGSNELNPFGVDFQKNGNVWNRVLAQINSDGDNCVNGFELGDLDGDGFMDFGAEEENSNPGDRTDCSIALSEQTWGKIKELFKGD
jgi:hypothetical protein